MSDETAHEVVVSSLLELQARLRGDGAEETATRTIIEGGATQDLIRVPEAATPDDAPLAEPIAAPAEERLSIAEDDLVIEVTAGEDEPLHLVPDETEMTLAPVTPLLPHQGAAETRMAALAERLELLEAELEGVLERIETFDPESPDRPAAAEPQHLAEVPGQGVDSDFTDLQHAIDQRLGGASD